LNDAHSSIVQLAKEMAASGQYRSWRSIEARLRGDGLSRVREALNDAHVRQELDARCQTLRLVR